MSVPGWVQAFVSGERKLVIGASEKTKRECLASLEVMFDCDIVELLVGILPIYLFFFLLLKNFTFSLFTHF